MPAQDVPRSASVVVIGGGVDRAQRGLPPRGGRGPRRRARRAGRARLRVDLQGRGRGARAVLRRGQHRARAAQPARPSRRSREEFGQEIDLHQVGYLFLLDRPEHVAAFEKNVALQNELGVPSRMIEVAEAKRLSPLIDTDGLLAAAYSPTDGHCTPESVVLGYAGGGPPGRRPAAPRHARSTGSSVDGRTITRGADRPRARSRTDTVVCAAGAWSRAVGGDGGRRPARSTPLRRQILVDRARCRASTRATPFTIDFATSFYFHARGPGAAARACPTRTRCRASSWALRRLAAAAGRGGRAPGARPRRRRHRRRLGRPLREHPRPQRADRRGRRGRPVPLRHRLLRPRLPDGPRGRRGGARPRTSARTPGRRRQRARRPAGSGTARRRPELNIV